MRTAIWIVIFGGAIAIAFAVDAKVVDAIHRAGVDAWLRASPLREILKVPGWFPFTLVIAAIVAIAHRARWRAAGLVVLAGILSGSNEIIKWLTHRARPLGQKGFAFPSGHASLAFATAAALAVSCPRWRWAFFAAAAIVAFERVAENAHHLSDVIAAAALGVACAQVAKWLLHERAVPVAGDPLLQRAGERADSAAPRE